MDDMVERRGASVAAFVSSKGDECQCVDVIEMEWNSIHRDVGECSGGSCIMGVTERFDARMGDVR